MSMRSQRFLLFRIHRYQDTEAFSELYDVYFERIRRFVYFKLPKDLVDEVTAEVFLRGWEYATSSPVENAAALFYRIARNLIADHYRKKSIVTTDIDSVEVESLSDVEHEVEVRMESGHLLTALRTLKGDYQEVLVMRYLDEMSISEIASAMNKSSNSVRVLLYRAKRALKESVTHI